MTIVELKEQIKKLPPSPGIYLFSKGGKILYIGKALNLKNRIANYLKTEDSRIQRMIHEADKIDFIDTKTDIEALIMESQFIKKHRPDFNIMLRDDKQYFFVGFTKDNFPRFLLTHQPMNFIDYIGPFTDGSALKTTLRLLRKIFPYCTCKQSHNNFCLNYHIGKCPGFCCLKNPAVSKEQIKDYQKNIKAVKDILSGEKDSLIKKLEKEMTALSAKQEYEKAMELQYKIEKIKRVFENAQIIERQKTHGASPLETLKEILNLPKIPNRIEAYDIANIQGKHATGAMVVFEDGKPNKSQYRKFRVFGSLTSKQSGGDTGMLKEVLSRRLNHPEWAYPDLIIMDGGKGQLNAAIQVLKTKYPVLEMGLIALTKDERHAGEKIYIAGKENSINLSKLPMNVRNLILHIDAEAHRFAISYYRHLHKKTMR